MPARSSSAVLGKLEDVLGLVDEKYGPIKGIAGFRQDLKQPAWWVYHAQLTRPLGQYFVEFDCDAWGASIDKNEALFKCLGEALERYCMYCSLAIDKAEIRPASDCTFMNDLPRCAPEEACGRDFKGVQPSWMLTQARVREVASGEEHWLPAQYVHFSFRPPEGEKRVAISHSSGSAFHQTLHQAIWSGLCEVAERDAFSLFWLNQLPVREIVVDSGWEDYGIYERICRLQSAGLKVRWFDITTDFRVPTVFAMVTGDEFPFATFGAACGADPVKTLCKAVDEVNLVRLAQISGKQSANVPSFEEFSWVRSLRNHADLYAFWQDCPAFDFFLNESAEKLPLSQFVTGNWWTEPENYRQLQERCADLQSAHGMTVLYSENTLDDVAKFGFGVKVVVPQMLPISVSETAKWLGTPRLADHAAKHSLIRASNPYPHPFP